MVSKKSLKILQLATHLNIGGITSYIYMAGSHLVRLGHEVWVVSGGGERREALEKKGMTCRDLPIRTKNEFSPRIFFSLPRLVALVRQEKFDVIHAHTRTTQVLAAMVSFFTRTPVVTTAHGFYKPRLSRRFFKCWGKCVIAISELVAEDLEKRHKIPKSRIRIIQNAIDIEDFESRLAGKNSSEARIALGIPQDALVVSCVARLVRDKGQEYLVKAVKELKKKNPRIFLLLVGGGREERHLRILLRKTGLEKNSRMLGSIPDTTAVFAATDVFVLPATYREGFGLAIVEAMIARKPVIATDIWAINTVIRNRVNGFLVEPKKKEALAEAITFIAAHPDVASSVADNGYQIATQLYSIDRLVSELETVYQETLSLHNKKYAR